MFFNVWLNLEYIYKKIKLLKIAFLKIIKKYFLALHLSEPQVQAIA